MKSALDLLGGGNALPTLNSPSFCQSRSQGKDYSYERPEQACFYEGWRRA
ncbi:hypothetical protein AA14337_3324 [Acetobacter malorum DSM 14337]|uniref:Uncharacterized protein n=1 Tax=Acetobacter malorum DSM 14337 TaxID=1307910 RepID=A0ABQ0Q100_9PROT|nr:hypothetical protein [Acetobacter malorum]GBQ86450.1 hypothetical protein AA14337_3324 [Acetobacter malorum DSM 14337]